jgi:Tol biopolymer transport system component
MIVLNYRAAPLAACLMVSCATIVNSQAQTPSPTSAPKTPITHEKLWMMKRVGAPAVSPDGKWVIFSVLEPSYEADKDVSDLWMTAADGSLPPRRLTNTKAAEGAVAWSAGRR